MIWISFAILIGVIAWSAASLRIDRGDALGIPFVAIGIFVFVYLVQPIQLILTGSSELFLTQWQFAKALLVSALMLAFFMWGWLHPGEQRRSAGVPWDPRVMWNIGFVAACVGLLLDVVFLERSGGIAASFSESHGSAMAFKTNTAYLYDGPFLILSGSVMMMFGVVNSNGRWKRLMPYLFLLIPLATAILTGSRGGFFQTGAIYFVGRSIARRKRVNFGQTVRMLLPLAVGVFVMVAYRGVLHLGPQTTEDVPSVETAYNDVAGVSEYGREHGFVAQEFVYHAAVLDTVDQTGKLDYGIGWAEFLVINPIPKILWPEKPARRDTEVTWDDIYEQTSITIAPGSAPGMVADLYARFHLLSAIFFLLLGMGLRRLYVSACSLSSPVTAVGYVMFYAVSLNMFAQGFGSIFVPLGYSMAPAVFFAWLSRRRQARAMSQQRQFALRQFAATRIKQWS